MRAVVIGGGYAGVMAVVRLTRRMPEAEVVLVEPQAGMTERVRNHEVAAGRAVPLRPYRAILGPARHVAARAVALDVAHRRVRLEDGSELTWDRAVVAVGARPDFGGIPGAATHALSISHQPEEIALRIAGLPAGAGVAVVGAGLSGLETATELAEARPDLAITLVDGRPIPAGFSPRGAASIAAALDALGVSRRVTRVVAVSAAGVACDDGFLAASLVVWCGGARAHPLAEEAGLAVDPAGRALLDPWLRALGHPEVSVIGDAAAVRLRGHTVRMACASGMPMGAYVAERLAAEDGEREQEPFKFGFTARCVSLGRHRGLIQRVDCDDTPLAQVVAGRGAAWVKEAVCRFAGGSAAGERYGVPYVWPRIADAPAAPAAELEAT